MDLRLVGKTRTRIVFKTEAVMEAVMEAGAVITNIGALYIINYGFCSEHGGAV